MGARHAEAWLKALRADTRFRAVPLSRTAIEPAVREAALPGTPVVAVAGGDGTLGQAAAALVGSDTALAVLPAGTRNHFARDHEIPLDPPQALDVAASGVARTVDVGRVEGRIFLNTSSVGSYVNYVRLRWRMERWLGYGGASVVAAMRNLRRFRGYAVRLEVDGMQVRYEAPVVFIGVGERELARPSIGGRKRGGRRGLHVLVLSETSRLAAVRLAARAFTTGLTSLGEESGVHGFLVDACEVDLPRPQGTVALDGELEGMRAPLRYQLERDALRVIGAGDSGGLVGAGVGR